MGRHDSKLANRITLLATRVETAHSEFSQTADKEIEKEFKKFGLGEINMTQCKDEEAMKFKNFCFQKLKKSVCEKIQNATLAYPEDIEELTFLQMFQDSKNWPLLLGLFKNETSGLWTSSKGDTIPLLDLMWGLNQPKGEEKCAGFERTTEGSYLKLKELECGNDSEYVCKYPAELQKVETA